MEPAFSSNLDLAKGCLFGALLGDAIGAYLEFIGRKPNKTEIEKAFTLPGGGAHKLNPAQITDDGELTLSLAYGLVNGKGKLNLNTIATKFSEWFTSRPFDIGNTTRNSIGKAINMKEKQAYLMRKAALEKSMKSQSNGSLMRNTPLAIWCHKLNPDEIATAAKEETSLTHPNMFVVYANSFYGILISHLLLNQNDREGAYKKAKEWAKKNSNEEFMTWLDDIEANKLLPANYNEGYVKIAFSYAINAFRKNQDYLSALQEILAEGGDTDTNLCIAGGLIGACVGEQGLPKELLEKLKNSNPQTGSRARNSWLWPRNGDKLVEELLQYAPNELSIIGGSDEGKN